MKHFLHPAAAMLLATALLALAAPARSAPLGFAGTLSVRLGVPSTELSVAGSGVAQVSDDGSFHLLSLSLGSTAFGPAFTSVRPPPPTTISFQLTLTKNLAGSFTALSGGPPGGGTMGLTGLYRICVIVLGPCPNFQPLPLTVTGTQARGFGVGGTQIFPGPLAVTMQHAAWTIGEPALLTIHAPGSTVTTPVLPSGFAHGPASVTSSTAQVSGAVRLVTASKAFTTLDAAFPELPVIGVLTLHFVPEPGTLVLLASGGLAIAWARRQRRHPS